MFIKLYFIKIKICSKNNVNSENTNWHFCEELLQKIKFKITIKRVQWFLNIILSNKNVKNYNFFDDKSP